jgi:hypothetical protein
MNRPEHHAQVNPDAQVNPVEDGPHDTHPSRSARGAWRIVVVLLLLAAVLGVVVFRNLVTSERYLSQVWHDMAERGTELTVEGCVDAILAWNHECEAMKGLCDLSVTGMMVSCLQGGDRRSYCAAEGSRMQTTHFGVSECSGRALSTRHEKAVCAASYRAVGGHCRQLILSEAL